MNSLAFMIDTQPSGWEYEIWALVEPLASARKEGRSVCGRKRAHSYCSFCSVDSERRPEVNEKGFQNPM